MPIPASVVSMEVIIACAAKGEVLPVCSTEGGVHADLALFLGSEVHPGGVDGDVTDRGSFDEDRANNTTVVGESDGYVNVGEEPGSTTIWLKTGFRVILFATSLEFSRLRLASTPLSPPAGLHSTRREPHATQSSSHTTATTSLVFLSDLPAALAGIQLVRFGGLDSIGNEADDRHDDNEGDDENDTVSPTTEDPHDDKQSAADEACWVQSGCISSLSNGSNSCNDVPAPPLVLGGMGLVSRPGFETSTTMQARFQEETVGAFPAAVGAPEIEKSMAALNTANKEAFSYSHQLSATHEAVIAILASRPPCFDVPICCRGSQTATLPGGEPRPGVTDEVEGDQNNILNKLIETVLAYKSTIEKTSTEVPTCDRNAQEARAKTGRAVGQLSQRLAKSAVRFLARTGDMFHAWGLDPMIHSPVFPGVRCLIYGAIREASDLTSGAGKIEGGAVKRAILNSLAHNLSTRIPRDCAWIVPLAAMAASSTDGFPAHGWWDTCAMLMADRQRVESNTSSQLTLAKLVGMVDAETRIHSITGNVGVGAEISTSTVKIIDMTLDGDLQEHAVLQEHVEATERVIQGLAQVRAVVDPWLDHSATSQASTPIGRDGAANSGSNSDQDDGAIRGRATLSPQQWDLGLDTSGWARDRGAATAMFTEQSVSTTGGRYTLGRNQTTNTSREGADIAGCKEVHDGTETADLFFTRLSQLWTTVKEDWSKLSAFQAVAAKPFCREDVLQRLVLLETTMNGIFARLPRHVLSKPLEWSDWINTVRQTLSSGTPSSIGRMQFLLSHPPPIHGPATVRRQNETSGDCAADGHDLASTSSSSSTSSDSGYSSDDEKRNSCNNSHASGGKEYGSAMGDTLCSKPQPSTASPRHAKTTEGSAHSSMTGARDPGTSSPSNKSAIPDEPGSSGAPRLVRRDSRERMKFKLGHVDGLEEAAAVAAATAAVNITSATAKSSHSGGLSIEAKRRLTARASSLFGVSSEPVGAGIGVISLAKSSSPTLVGATQDSTLPAGVVGVMANSDRNRPLNGSGDNGSASGSDEEEQDAYITFVAESFRPQRDNTDWHREAQSTPPPKLPKKSVESAVVDNAKVPVPHEANTIHTAMAKPVQDVLGGAESGDTVAGLLGKTKQVTKVVKLEQKKHRKHKSRTGEGASEDAARDRKISSRYGASPSRSVR